MARRLSCLDTQHNRVKVLGVVYEMMWSSIPSGSWRSMERAMLMELGKDENCGGRREASLVLDKMLA